MYRINDRQYIATCSEIAKLLMVLFINHHTKVKNIINAIT